MAQQAIQTKVLRITGYITTTFVIILSLISLFADCVTITSVFGNEMPIFEGICSPSPEEQKSEESNGSKISTKNTPSQTTKAIPPTEFSILENQPQFVAFAKTHLSIQFQNLDGEEFVTLSISPQGHQSIIKAVVGSDTFEFESSTGMYALSVLNIDYQGRIVSVQVSKKQTP